MSASNWGYDSTQDTQDHIDLVRKNLTLIIAKLEGRAFVHDLSKLESPEKEGYDQMVWELKQVTFGTPEYKAVTDKYAHVIEHHYAHNSHHPQHYGLIGTAGMCLLDVIEMLADWKAASMRPGGVPLAKTIDSLIERCNITDEPFISVIKNTAARLGWLDEEVRI